MNRPDSKKILIIDDDARFVEVLTIILEEAGFTVNAARSGKDGLRAAYDFHPDLILLDISMPGMDGFQVLDTLRMVTDVPIIMLTAMGFDSNRIRSMDKGAVDFLVKGMSPEAVLAHIHARLRVREKQQRTRAAHRVDDKLLVDLPRRTVRLDNSTVYLTPLQWRLFKLLVENEGRVSSYKSLLNAGWEYPEMGDLRSVKVQISLLRKRLNDDPYASRYIHTVREEGYLFEVREEPSRPAR
jgi:two-component system, OmpR family, KDP operon response regulator KdpE